MGQLVTGRDEVIPLGLGTVSTSTNRVQPGPTWSESPIGNVTNAFNLIYIDWLTGRARVERQEIL
jgi:hypothetical protein